MFSSKKRSNKAYKNARIIDFDDDDDDDDDDEFILFSDCYRGDNSFSYHFKNNRNIYFHPLKHYYTKGFQYCEVGDGGKLRKRSSFNAILNAHKTCLCL